MKAAEIEAALAGGEWPAPLRADLKQVYPPLFNWLRDHSRGGEALVIGLCGAQGTGKSSLAAAIQQVLGAHLRWRCISLSLDDFYLSRAQRQALAQAQHPLLATRGVPGTHELDRLRDVLEQAKRGQGGLRWPRFDKVADERCAESEWHQCAQAPDLVILEGWCVGVPPQEMAELLVPVNSLETAEDPDGQWRNWVNAQLADYQQQLWSALDGLIFMAAPSFDAVLRWRTEQERGNLRYSSQKQSRLSDPAQMRRFLAHYERLTRHALDVLPSRSDVLIQLNEAHQVERLRVRPER